MRNYHHGNLPAELMREAAVVAAESGADSITLRDLARRIGVSHSAPAHHFGSRQGLLTAMATDGFNQLVAALEPHTDDLTDCGVAYAKWALANPGLYSVMWERRLLDDSNQALVEARSQAWHSLAKTLASSKPGWTEADQNAAFIAIHGLVTTWLTAVRPSPTDVEAATRETLNTLNLLGNSPNGPQGS